MKAERKADATAGKQRRARAATEKLNAAPQTQSSNSSGESPSIQAFRAGQTGEVLRDEDWNFAKLCSAPESKASRAELIAACCYEYARESKHMREAASRWLQLLTVRRELEPHVERIAREWASGGVRIGGEAVTFENYKEVAAREFDTRVFCQDRRLPWKLASRYRRLLKAEATMEFAEKACICAVGESAPHLSGLARHLVEDCPWLLIASDDRQQAIASASRAPSEAPLSVFGMRRGFAPAFECVSWTDFEMPEFAGSDYRSNKDLDYRHIARDPESVRAKLERWVDSETARRVAPELVGDEMLPVRIRWARFTNREIVEDFKSWVSFNRPPAWKHLACHSGRPEKEVWFATRLKNLAALRLQHFHPPREAWEKFCCAWSNEDKSNYRTYREDALHWFGRLCPFGEPPRHGAPFLGRNDTDRPRRSTARG